LLKTIQCKNDEAILFGKKIITKRKVAWYGESEFSYKYSGVTKTANIFTREFKEFESAKRTIARMEVVRMIKKN
tara:strand:- start:5144 stop:5365 length:222 start_codon:yes stop_codon:yes gene_type:complete